MMLSLTWFILLSLLGWFYAYQSWQLELKSPGGDFEPADKQLSSHGALLMAIALGWEAVGEKVYQWLFTVIPHQEMDAHLFTVVVCCTLIGFAWVAIPMFLPLLFMGEDRKLSFRNLIFKISPTSKQI